MPRGHSLLLSLCLACASPLAAQTQDDQPETIVVQDPHYGEVLYYFYQEDYFPAIVRVLAGQQMEKLPNHEDEAELLLGGMQLSYGNHLAAADVFERLLDGQVDPALRNRTWFFLAKVWYQRGYLDRAEQALGYVAGQLPENLAREANMLKAQILIDSGRFDEAIRLLSAWQGNTEWARYAKYNTGVAMVRNGEVRRAEALLDELGSMPPFNEEMLALRDKANLALGYALLQDQRAAAAKTPLQRVRLDGPFSNKALLGVGWADAEGGDYRRALVPWMELRGRDLLDPAVQESMLAVPYAFSKLDAFGQSADHYLNAIEAFHEELARIDGTISLVESGEMFNRFVDTDVLDSTGWYWELENLPDSPESRYLYPILASHEFQEGLKNYRDLRYMYDNLDRWQDDVVVYENMLQTRLQAYREKLPIVDEFLTRADIDGKVARKLAFDETLDNIEETSDWLAMATREEFDMWSEVTAYENSRALQSGLPEAEKVLQKINLLKGVLQWRLEGAFQERMLNVRNELREVGAALVETQRARRQIDQTLLTEPRRFAELEQRVDGLVPRIETMKAEVNGSLDAQRGFLQSIAVEELRAQQQRLKTYTVQAQFALAAIYDTAATAALETGAEE